MTVSLRALLSVFACCLSAGQTSADVYDTPEQAAADPDFAVQGEYARKDRGIQVVAQGGGEFLIVIYKGGLPGAGWNGQDRQVIEGETEDVEDLVEDCRKVERESPTLGARAPTGAVVLFDGSEQSLQDHWKAGAKKTDDGLLKQGATSTDTFKDFRLHLEFRTPYMPNARGQGRGNSGLYYQGRYETQILDSFGLEGKQNETGGIYSIRKPDLNMCLPPLSWQTYDGEFRAARFKGGKKIADATLTVRLNGVVVQSSVALTHATTAAPVREGEAPGPIFLQNHGNEVRFRNIWVEPFDADREARRPLIPGFERFHAADDTAAEEGGRLLLGELNCTACHAASGELAAQLTPKQAPIMTNAGNRLRADYVWEFLQDPHGSKPGTTMPAMLEHLTETERQNAATAIASFLSTTGTAKVESPQKKFARSGERLFHEIGCVACHMPRNGKEVSPVTSVPLPDLGRKYSISGLAGFLKEPHAVRPSGRMPGFSLDDNQSRDLAHFLVGDVLLEPREPTTRYFVFNEGYPDVPDLGTRKPASSGTSAGLDIEVAGRDDDFSIRFESNILISKAGTYRFHLGSDDGSFLYVDGKEIVDVDGVHPHQTKSGSIDLDKGVHSLTVDYSEVGGQQSLGLEIEGPGISRQSIDGWLTLNEDGSPPKKVAKKTTQEEAGKPSGFEFDGALVATGKQLFGSLGCASCHELKQDGRAIPSSLVAPGLADCREGNGCLSPSGKSSAPEYDLNSAQRMSIAAALSRDVAELSTQQTIVHAMKSFNCYSCHQRDGFGGPQADRHALFVSQIPEMGDEGRVPPPLTGVGDKLKQGWLEKLLREGAKDRPYMLTRMPRFGAQAVHLAKDFVKVDRVQGVEIANVDDAAHRMVSNGRKLVGSEGLSCVKCHTFGKYKATGIQALDLQTMASRINEDWFHRYLPNPDALRPGTRMPTAFPNGKSVATEIYEGDTGDQVAAIWQYLKQGNKAKVPIGVAGGMIELKPDARPVLYRNFLVGLTPRGIAVGYPEKANIAWDADRMSLSQIWHGRFIDAAKHWQGRGQGRQEPLGDNTLNVETTVPVAVVESLNSPWPTDDPRSLGYRFQGYRLDSKGRPSFRYRTDEFEVVDTPIPVVGEKEPSLMRVVSVRGESVDNLYFRAGVGALIEEEGDGWYRIDKSLRVHVDVENPVLRQSDGRWELLVPLILSDGGAELTQKIAW